MQAGGRAAPSPVSSAGEDQQAKADMERMRRLMEQMKKEG
jgi:hypothetical protein